ncbi:hypothetical protein SELMODRAFT_79236 [Selaginella moellendorffii]|uniref:UspA domain-containing protein n=2 Tax=Selaginella moellendorffii TaxID=88036 RepID=D8QVT5_SELML|nr:universal stress protein PHOS34 isoform X2 [Selaginella moellendorffii]EFJ36115.1 hypothetical protein SELMODRAFT_79236 [Selaginella moellendorffii]|eukprot:XP_024541072.1 universal stress protein PHOS34 isoform X2 [Selaginella moellendorffii]
MAEAPPVKKKSVKIAAAAIASDEAADPSGAVNVGGDRKAKKVIVAIDESQESIRALRYALDTVVQPGDGLVLLHSQFMPHSYVGPGGPGFYITPDLVAATRKHQENSSKVLLDKAKRICGDANVHHPELLMATGDPRDSICDAVEKIHADLLVMGSRGHGAIKRTFLGSVSDYCTHNAKCPVLIVRK